MVLAGHNAGKKYIRGVGYRYPPQEKKPPISCCVCGKVKPPMISRVESVRPIVTKTYCKDHEPSE